MNTKRSGVAVSVAQTQEEINEALEFCGSVYERNYGTHWLVPPDLFFVARHGGRIVGTGGLTFAASHAEIASERYFCLTDGMQRFVQMHRERIVEFGRFASITEIAAKAILYSVLSYSTKVGMHFMLAWANPSVHRHTANRLGVNFWPIHVPLNLDSALSDSRWASPPTGFFVREQPPELILGVIPFWENVARALAEQCHATDAIPHLQTYPSHLVVLPSVKPTSVAKSASRLMRGDQAVASLGNGSGASLSNLAPLSKPVERQKTD